MQIRSRELLWPQSPKHSLSKNGTEQFKFKVIQFNCYNTTYNIENYKTDKRFFLTPVPSPPLQVIPLIEPFLCNILTLPNTEMINLKALKLCN